MTRYFDSILGGLREELFRMGGCSEAILEKAIRSVAERDLDLASQVEPDDQCVGVELAFADLFTHGKTLSGPEAFIAITQDYRTIQYCSNLASPRLF